MVEGSNESAATGYLRGPGRGLNFTGERGGVRGVYICEEIVKSSCTGSPVCMGLSRMEDMTVIAQSKYLQRRLTGAYSSHDVVLSSTR